MTLARLLAKNDERHAHTLTSTRSTILTAPRSEAVSTSNQFGTFGGVFTPSILTILGAVMFMRAGFVTGQAGVGTMLVILLVSKLVTLLTGPKQFSIPIYSHMLELCFSCKLLQKMINIFTMS